MKLENNIFYENGNPKNPQRKLKNLFSLTQIIEMASGINELTLYRIWNTDHVYSADYPEYMKIYISVKRARIFQAFALIFCSTLT